MLKIVKSNSIIYGKKIGNEFENIRKKNCIKNVNCQNDIEKNLISMKKREKNSKEFEKMHAKTLNKNLIYKN